MKNTNIKANKKENFLFKAFSSLVCLLIEDVEILVKLSMLSEYIFIGGTVGGLLWLRKTQPKAFRPIKVTFLNEFVY